MQFLRLGSGHTDLTPRIASAGMPWIAISQSESSNARAIDT